MVSCRVDMVLDITIGRRHGMQELDNKQDVFGEFNV